MNPGDWVIVDVEDVKSKSKEERWDGKEYLIINDYEIILPPHFINKNVAEGQIINKPTRESHKGPLVEFPWIAEEEWKQTRIPWEFLEPSTCEEHGSKLYHDSKEQWYCPFCSAGGGATQSKS